MENETSAATPPSWAESILRLVLPPEHRDSVSGDLLEEYRESVLPARGASGADLWYLRQTAGFVLRATWWWGVLMAAADVTRRAFDWFVPPESFQARASATTYTAIALFLAAGFFTSWRTRSLRAGVLAGITTGLLSALLVFVGSLIMLGVWHDERTLWAIDRSGGLGEMFFLPFFLIVPGTILAALGGAVGRVAREIGDGGTGNGERFNPKNGKG